MGDFSFELPLRRALQRNPPDLRIHLLPPRGLLPTATPVLCADTSLDGYGFVIHWCLLGLMCLCTGLRNKVPISLGRCTSQRLSENDHQQTDERSRLN